MYINKAGRNDDVLSQQDLIKILSERNVLILNSKKIVSFFEIGDVIENEHRKK